MEALGANSWAFTQNLRVLGVPMGTRMTICRDGHKRLFVHSPNALTGAIQEQVAALGQVAVLFSPNIYHHMYVADWQRAWPKAIHVAPKQLAEKRPGLAYQHLLDDESTDSDLAPMTCPGFDLIELLPLRGTRRWHEWECYFNPDRVLVLTDLAFNLNDNGNPGLREFWPAIYTRLSGQRNKLTLPWIHRLLVANKNTFDQSLVQLTAWPFERVVLAHGDLPGADNVRVLLRKAA